MSNIPPPPTVSALLTPAETATHARVDRSTVYRWIRTGQLRAVRVGPRAIRVRAEDLDELLTPVGAR